MSIDQEPQPGPIFDPSLPYDIDSRFTEVAQSLGGQTETTDTQVYVEFGADPSSQSAIGSMAAAETVDVSKSPLIEQVQPGDRDPVRTAFIKYVSTLEPGRPLPILKASRAIFGNNYVEPEYDRRLERLAQSYRENGNKLTELTDRQRRIRQQQRKRT